MTEAEAFDKLDQMVTMTTSPALSVEDLHAALAASLIPDAAGVWPGQPGYQPTYDIYWAAAETSALRAMRAAMSATETVTRVTSEGTTFDVQPAPATDWAALERSWRARSRIGRELGLGDSLGVVEVAQPATGYIPASRALQW